MIAGIRCNPYFTKLEIIELCNQLNVSMYDADCKKWIHPLNTEKILSTVRVIWSSTVGINEVKSRVEFFSAEPKKHAVVVCGFGVTDIDEYKLETSTIEDVKDLIESVIVYPPHDNLEVVNFRKNVTVFSKILEWNRRHSVLGDLQTAFYRIKNPDDREKVRQRVYQYLSNETDKLTGVSDKKIVDHLNTDLVSSFRECVESAKTVGIDNAADATGFDRFEVAFILSKVGYDVNSEHA